MSNPQWLLFFDTVRQQWGATRPGRVTQWFDTETQARAFVASQASAVWELGKTARMETSPGNLWAETL